MNNLRMLLIFPLLIFLGGCFAAAVGGAVGAGSVVYYQGQLKTKEIASLEQTWFAVVTTMDDMGFKIIEKQKDRISAYLKARTTEDKKVRIKLKYENETRTDMSVRVGIFGDEKISRLIVNKIHKKLY
ncbi:MAG: DUF3568 family protein [Candidatus Dadabacteria bacterium]|nr:DUF3568 family protein [Candidatus Dadabacteria bacterium]NIQ14030.1 DUF3568 family protein [Candidatus Dadabacteria bacterium]